jgi:hypothetical protein
MKKSVALYDPYLDILGGGEKYILSVLKILEQLGLEINIFWDKDLSSEIKDRLSVNFNKLKFIPNIFNKASNIGKLITLKQFDYFFYLTDGSYFLSSAKKNFIYVMVPKKELVNMNFINKTKLFFYYSLKVYSK